ncbi:7TMR-DISMED2 domain-containing protein [Marinomonas sp.]|uniref:7TMR-DISMED2 domain-containing protein n=1 Tax=Marinomonas sp. TaxID=1904862 RepID=UPI003BA943C5
MLTVFRLLLTYCMLMGSLNGYSQNIEIGKETHSLQIRHNVEYLRDKTGKLSLDNVQDPNQAFVSVSLPFSAGFSNDIHWFRFTLQRDEETTENWLLSVRPSYLDSVKLFTKTPDGDYIEDEVGDLVPASQRAALSLFTPFSIPITLSNTEPHTFYLRLQTGSSTSLNLTLDTP